MKEYFITVMAVSLMGGVIVSLSPKGNNARYVRLLCGLCTVCCVAFPVVRFAQGGFDREEILSVLDYETKEKEYYDEIYNKKLVGAELKNAEIALKSEIIKELSLQNDSINVNIVTENKSDEICIESVEVIIYPSGLYADPREIEECVEERLGCPCSFFYDV